MAQAVSLCPLIAAAQVHILVSPCGIFGGQSGTRTGSSLSSLDFPINIIPPWLHTPCCTYVS
jgi:hypothetical protein